MRKYIFISILMILGAVQNLQAQSRPYLGPLRYTATTFTVFRIDGACYGPGIKIFVNNVDQTSSFNRGFCFYGICIYSYPFGTLRVGDVVKIEDFCGRVSDPITVLDDNVYLQVPSGAATAGNGIDPNFNGLPFAILANPLPVGKCTPVTVGSHALHRISASYGTNNNGTFTGGTMKINGVPITAADVSFEKAGYAANTTIDAAGALTYDGYVDLRTIQNFSGATPTTWEYQHNGVLAFDVQETTFGPLGYRLWSNNRVTVKEYKFDGSVIETDINQDFSAANFKMFFGNGNFKLLINDVEVKNIPRSVIYSTSNGTIANTSLQAYGSTTTWTPSASGLQYVTALIDGVRQVRQAFQVADDMTITETLVNVACNGGSTGSISVGVTGGYGVKEYSRDNGDSYQSSNVFSGLPAGSYPLKVRDAAGCFVTKTVNLTANSPLTLSATAINNVNCSGGNNGSVTLSAGGGAGFYQFREAGGTYASSSTINSLTAGVKAMYVRDAAGCEATINVTIGTNSSLTATATPANLACNGINTGSITVAQAGTASGPVLYSLDNTNFQGGTVFGSLAAATYTVYVKDNLCTITLPPVSISQPALLVPNVSVTKNVSCNGLSDGQITASASGGTGNTYFFSADGTNYTTVAANSHVFSGFAAGSYKIYVKDINGCVKDQIVSVTQPAVMALALTTKTDAVCYGQNGSATVTPSGGTAPYTYKIGTVSYASNVLSLAAGSYTVVATDANGCTASVAVQILQPSQISVSVSASTAVKCFGGNDGSLTATGSGGTGALRYSLNGGTLQSNPVFSGLSAGSYILTAQDASNCSVSATSFSVTQPTDVVANIRSQTNVACFGGNTGQVVVKATGGVGTYTFSKDGINFGTDSTFGGLIAGTYNFRVKDANNCLKSISATVTQPTDLIVGLAITQQVLCFAGSSAILTTTASGGVGPYQFALNGGTYANASPVGSATFVQSGLAIGTYQVSVRDANGCIKTTTQVVVTQPTDLIPSISSQTNVSCNAGSDGSVTLTATGGNATSYQYSKDGANFQSSATFSGLTTGNYTFTIKDANACTKTITTTVTQPAVPFSLSLVSRTNLSCYQNATGVINVATAGGTAPYTVSRDNANFQTATTFSGLSATAYVIYGKDAKGCLFNLPAVTLTEPTDINIVLQRKSDVDCDYYSRGEAQLLATGSNGNFNYTLSGSDFKFNVIPPVSNTTGLFTNLKAGDYTLTATDQVGCAKPFTVTISNKNTTINFDLTPTLPTACSNADGRIDVANMTGGRPPYQYSISGQNTVIGTPQFTGLLNGNYIVTVSDDLCSYKKEVSLRLPNSLNLSSIISPISCLIPDANLSINASGGNGSYQYALNSGAFSATNSFSRLHPNVYTVTVKDSPLSCQTVLSLEIKEQNRADLTFVERTNILCFNFNTGVIEVKGNNNLSPFSYSINNGAFGGSGRFQNLTAGTYKLMARTNFGCVDSLRAILTQPTLLTNTTTKTDNLCFGDVSGTLTISGNGGVSPYTFSKDGTNYQGTGAFNGLLAGAYTTYVKDQNQCVTPFAITLNQPTNVVVTPVYADTVRCFAESNGRITVNASGGTPGYQYSKDGSNYFASNAFGNLTAGNYTLFVKDANACVRNQTLNITQPDTLKMRLVSKANPLCYLGTDGNILVNAVGGNNGNVFTLNGGTGQGSPNFTTLGQGNYSIVVTDRKGCTHSVNNIQLLHPPQLQRAIVTKEPLCFKDSNGKIDLTITGGTMGYQVIVDGRTYPPTDGIRVFNFPNIPSRKYDFVTVDANGCRDSYSVDLKQPTALKMDVVATTNLCNGDSTGILQLFGKGATLPYQYSVVGGYKLADTTFLGTNYYEKLVARPYTVRIRDGNACRFDTLVTVKQPTRISFQTIYADTVRCFGEANGQLRIIANGGTPGYAYALDRPNYQTADTLKGLKAGSYKVFVRDKNNCIVADQAPFVVSEPAKLRLGVISQANPLCAGEQNGIIQVKAEGGNGGFAYLMDNIRKNARGYFDSLNRGDYTFKVTDRRGCSDDIAKVSLVWPAAMAATVVPKSPVCFGDANGQITLQVSGGTESYEGQLFEVGNKDNLKLEGFKLSSKATILSNLVAKSYFIRVKDGNNCEIGIPLKIADALPLNPIINLGGELRTKEGVEVCKGQTVTLNAKNPNRSVVWYKDDKIINTQNDLVAGAGQQEITVDQPGLYSVVVSNPTGCIASDNFRLVNNQFALKADFLLPTQAFVGDTVVALDITKPIPDEVIWSIPKDASLFQNKKDRISFIPYFAGEKSVTMIVRSGECRNLIKRDIKIFERNEINKTGDPYQYKLKDLSIVDIFPNPNYGSFNAKITFNTPNDFVIKLVRVSTGEIILNETISKGKIKEKTFEKQYNFNLIEGVYSLIVQTFDAQIINSQIIKRIAILN